MTSRLLLSAVVAALALGSAACSASQRANAKKKMNQSFRGIEKGMKGAVDAGRDGASKANDKLSQ